MQELWDANEQRWGDDVVFLSVNERGAEDGVPTIWSEHPDVSLMLLQDTSKDQAMWNSGASAYMFYVLDGDRNVVYAHYRLTVEDAKGEGQRAVDEIDAVLGARAR